VGWPAGFSTISTSAVSYATDSGASGSGTQASSRESAERTVTSSRTITSPGCTNPPFATMRPLTRTSPLSIARFTRAREAPSTSCVIALSRRAPASSSPTVRSIFAIPATYSKRLRRVDLWVSHPALRSLVRTTYDGSMRLRSLVAGCALVGLGIACSTLSLDGYTGGSPDDGGSDGDRGPNEAVEASTDGGPRTTGSSCTQHADCPSGVCMPIGSDDAGVFHSVCTTQCSQPADLRFWLDVHARSRAELEHLSMRRLERDVRRQRQRLQRQGRRRADRRSAVPGHQGRLGLDLQRQCMHVRRECVRRLHRSDERPGPLRYL